MMTKKSMQVTCLINYDYFKMLPVQKYVKITFFIRKQKTEIPQIMTKK